MKQLLAIVTIGLVLFACKKASKKPNPIVKKYTIKQMMNNEAVRGGSFSHDNTKLLITSNKSGIYNTYTVPTSGGDYTPITQSDSTSVYGVSYFPNDNRMLLRMDDNGNEVFHLFLRDLDGKITDLTPDKNARSAFFGWAKDKQSFFYTSNKRDPKYMDLYEMDIKTMQPKQIYKNLEGYDAAAISNNKKLLVLSKAITRDQTDLFLFDLTSKVKTKINKSRSSNRVSDFSPDDRYLYYTSDATGEFADLMKYDITNKTSGKVAEKGWDIYNSYFTTNGTYQVTSINKDAKTVVEVKEVATGNNIKLPDVSGSINGIGFSSDEKLMRLSVGGSNTPSNIFIYELESGKLTKVTHTLNNEINPDDLVNAKVIRYSSFDGVEVPAIYYLPKQASKDHKVPAMVWVHGGPGGQSRQNYSPLIQYLVNHGYAILAVNNRGSSGYGKTFYSLDDKNHGEGDLQDCIEGKNWLAQQPEIDADKIGIMGGSYGGYMTMAALTYTPEEFKVGINIFGVTNWLRTLKSIPSWWETYKTSLYQELGNPYTQDSIRLRKISPLFHTNNVTKPLMVLQGSKDPRVLQIESDEIVANVKKNGVPVEYVLFEDEGHGFVKKENQIKAYSKILSFLNKHLKKKDSAQ